MVIAVVLAAVSLFVSFSISFGYQLFEMKVNELSWKKRRQISSQSRHHKYKRYGLQNNVSNYQT